VEYPDALEPVDVATDSGLLDVATDSTPLYVNDDQGCSCRAGAATSPRGTLPVAGLALLVVLRRRRRR
jgi:MYXO-CTERM domain-containing protein